MSSHGWWMMPNMYVCDGWMSEYLDLPVPEIGEEVFQRVDACCVDVCHGCHHFIHP